MRPGPDAVDAHVVFAAATGEMHDEPFHRRLRRLIRRGRRATHLGQLVAPDAHPRRERCDRDRRAGAAGDEVGPRGTAQEHHAVEVELDESVPHVGGFVGPELAAARPRIRHDDVDAAVEVDGVLHERIDGRLVGDVAVHERGVAAGTTRDRIAAHRPLDRAEPVSSLRAQNTTRAPSRAKRCTIASPMPVEPPVTIATFESSRPSRSAILPLIRRRRR